VESGEEDFAWRFGSCAVSAGDGEHCVCLGGGEGIQQCVSDGDWAYGVARAGLSAACGGDV